MNNLSIALSILLALMTVLLIRATRRELILRHIFIDYSDWCGEKIAEMAKSASREIVFLAQAEARTRGREMSDESARDDIPDDISGATKEWTDVKNKFQSQLKRNGISPLNIDDLDRFVIYSRYLKY